MKKFLLPLAVFFLLLLFNTCSKSDGVKKHDLSLYTYVPDDKFEELLIKQGYDDEMDNYVLTSKIENVKSLMFTNGFHLCSLSNCRSSEIKNFTGIEDFVSLEYFDCSHLGLIGLDLSKNTALKYINCSINNLTSLDFSKNINLEVIDCGYNKLTSLKLNTSVLTGLYCHENQLKDIDVSQNSNLRELTCFGNELVSLNISKNTMLKQIQCGGNLLTTLDISNNLDLNYLECNNNPLTCVKVNQEQLNLNFNFCSRELFSLNCN